MIRKKAISKIQDRLRKQVSEKLLYCGFFLFFIFFLFLCRVISVNGYVLYCTVVKLSQIVKIQKMTILYSKFYNTYSKFSYIYSKIPHKVW